MAARASRRDLLIITLVWAGAVLIVRPWGNFPINDDWSWALAVDALVTHHTWHLTDFTGMPLATQTVWGALFCLPFGFSFPALRLSGLVAAWVTLAGVRALLLECGATRRQAIVGTLAVLLSPLFFTLALTYMTDLPFMACAVWAILVTIRYQRDGRPAQLAAIVALLVAATLERQTGLPVAVAVALALAMWPGRWLQAAAAIVVPLAALTAYSAVLNHYGAPYFYNTKSGALFQAVLSTSPLVWRAAAVSALGTFVYLGLLMSPVVLASRLTRWRSLPAAALGAALAIVPAAGILYKRLWMPIDTSILRDVGLNPVLLAREDLWPHAPHRLWIAVTAAGLIAGAVVGREMLLVALRDWRALLASRRSMGPIVALSACFVLSTTPLWFVQTFDRYYLWPFVLLLALWTCLHAAAPPDAAAARPPWTAAAAVLLAGLALFDVVALHDYFSFSRARWAAVDALRDAGVSVDDIDGGFEVNGLLSYHPERPFDESHPWYGSKTHPAALLSLGPVEGYAVVATHGFARWMPPGTGIVYVLKPSDGGAASR
jgi:hypothetical protein